MSIDMHEEYTADRFKHLLEKKRMQDSLNAIELYDADPNCNHDVQSLWSGVKCRKCRGWYCA